MTRRAIVVGLVLGGVLLPRLGRAQETPGDSLPPVIRPAEPIPLDSLAFGESPADTIAVLAARFREGDGLRELAAVPDQDRLPRNPRNAALRAFAIPGWGQLHTGHPWRAVFFAAAEVGFFGAGYLKQREALDVEEELTAARRAYIASLPDSIPIDPLEAETAFNRTSQAVILRNQIDSIEERREDFVAYGALSVIFAAVDAYVAAQLDPLRDGPAALSLGLGADPWAGRLRATLRWGSP
ncbi:MAG: DUF5683 domain-containing protein [Gemmatimonadota bacterium]